MSLRHAHGTCSVALMQPGQGSKSEPHGKQLPLSISVGLAAEAGQKSALLRTAQEGRQVHTERGARGAVRAPQRAERVAGRPPGAAHALQQGVDLCLFATLPPRSCHNNRPWCFGVPARSHVYLCNLAPHADSLRAC